MIRQLTRYFVQGLIYLVPIAVVIVVVFKLLQFLKEDVIDTFLTDYLLAWTGISIVNSIIVYAIATVLLIALVATAGLVGSSIIFQPVEVWLKRQLDRAPLIKTIYQAIRDLMSAFVGQKKSSNQPVMVKMVENSELYKPGFITREDLSQLGIDEGMVAVYLPHSYAWSGNLFIVPAKNVRPIDVRASDMMKFIVSGGVSEIEDEE